MTQAERPDPSLDPSRLARQHLLWVRWWNDTHLSFGLTRPEAYAFKPGQYSRLGLDVDGDGSIVWRAYSIVSAPSEDSLEYYGVLVPDGRFTQKLRGLMPGSEILLDRQVFGVMTPDRFTDGRDLWAFATGTGLGPFVCMLRDGACIERFENLVVVHGARTLAELGYRDELTRAAVTSGGRLRVLACVTREGREDRVLPAGVLRGRITELLASGGLAAATGLPFEASTSRAMLCGNPAMIEELRKMLHQRGMQPVRRAIAGHFLTENYW